MAYGARLESVLGASPQGFESPILRGLSLVGTEVRFSSGSYKNLVWLDSPCLRWRSSSSDDSPRSNRGTVAIH